MLQGLKRQNHRANIACLTIPNQLDLALILEQDKAIPFRQGFPLLNHGDQIALLGLAQFVGSSIRARHRQTSRYSWNALTTAPNEGHFCALKPS